jgi:N-acetylmuramoyl-L-alanine amidase
VKHIILIFITLSSFCNGQTIKQCKQRFDAYLNFRGALNNLVKFEEDVISIYNTKGIKEFAIYSHELEMMAEFFEHTPFKQQEQLLKLKGTKKYSKRQKDSVWIYVDDRKKLPKKRKGLPLQGYRVAIDPGHFAASLDDAQIEQKYVCFVKDSINNPNDSIKIFESELTFNTAQILQKMLEEQGAQVFLTRTKNNFTSFNCTYQDWVANNKQRVLDSLKAKDVISLEKYNKLIKATPYKFFWDFFRDYDLANRAKKINQFNPHATAIIHYNVDEKNEPWKKMTHKNFTMTFIGGAFTSDNFEKPESRIQFLRLLLTKQLNQSEKLASQTVTNFNKNLGIEIASQFDADYLKDNCIPTQSKGVYSRNLILCRIINSPLVYGEALYQDNAKECVELMKKDVNNFGVKTNTRVLNAANSYYQALYQFLRSL